MNNISYIDFILEKERCREDKDNIFCTGISDREFINFAIKYLLGDDWYVIDPLGDSQIIQIALEEILKKYSKKFKKELADKRKKKEKPKLTEDEKVILRNLPKEYKWIARDTANYMYLFKNKPIKNTWMWDGAGATIFMFHNLFQFIEWEDEEPYSIEELLKGEEK